MRELAAKRSSGRVEDFLSPLPPDCIYIEEDRRWVGTLQSRVRRFAGESDDDLYTETYFMSG